MMRHHDLICRLRHIAEHYQLNEDDDWWDNQGVALSAEPDWPDASIMVVSWPEHVHNLRINNDCTISGPYESLAEALACASRDVYVMPDVA